MGAGEDTANQRVGRYSNSGDVLRWRMLSIMKASTLDDEPLKALNCACVGRICIFAKASQARWSLWAYAKKVLLRQE